ncbi:CTP synthetase [Candidatus Phycorickettsia trachydisci]|uniref:CTP synthase n=1 Tax=Candidatus Phycorickettsia trachydisci TaxID=2115978 RepID=A0A2P1PA54_9RICK|nr:CTP synthase [Candidatus Phycorickettsia trachydisci]AVP88147.1 CTP synthetase [Candidatus Phycorickettsia trachydisci]
MTKFIFFTGGVVSSLGKGIAASSLAACLQARGFKVKLKKIDPYLNINPGSMSPYEHGEVFVTHDGTEADLDLGHYERFTGIQTDKSDSISAGQIYSSVLKNEREGAYLGETVQVIPHITDEIKNFITKDSGSVDFVICEIGGTVGDIEGLPFLEAIRQISTKVEKRNVLYVHVTLLPFIAAAKELKTKPTQHSVKELLRIGIQPDIILCRSSMPVSKEIRNKISMFCNVMPDRVIEAPDLASIYQAPLVYHNNGLDEEVCKYFGLNAPEPELDPWKKINESMQNLDKSLTIGIVGKYVNLSDAYKSLIEALVHAGLENKTHINIKWIDSEAKDINNQLEEVQGIIVPGGFGVRGVDGKLKAIKYARENLVPFLGICFGMQLAVVEAFKNVLGLKSANSAEIDPQTSDPVICVIDELQNPKHNVSQIGTAGVMRSGEYDCILEENSKLSKVYNSIMISERYRYRYTINKAYLNKKSGLRFIGSANNEGFVDAIEHESHPWFIGVQFHPEFKSSPFKAHPLFIDFVRNALSIN